MSRKTLEFAVKEAKRLIERVEPMIDSDEITDAEIMTARRLSMDVIHAMNDFRKSSRPCNERNEPEALVAAGL